MTEPSAKTPPSRDLNEIAEQTQPAALRPLDNAGLVALLRELRQMKAAEQDPAVQKTLGQAIRRAAAEKRERQAPQEPAAEAGAKPADKPGKAEEKARKLAEQTERKRVREAERTERKALREAEKARLKTEKLAKPGKGKGKDAGKNKAAKPARD